MRRFLFFRIFYSSTVIELMGNIVNFFGLNVALFGVVSMEATSSTADLDLSSSLI
jgi:hypothetical protein